MTHSTLSHGRAARASTIGIVLCCAAMATPAAAAITAFWAPLAGQPWHVPYPAAAIQDSPALANMETWDLRVTTDGDWASAGMRATLPAGATYFHHPFGGNTVSNPAIPAAFPGAAFDTYVTGPGDTGVGGAPAILGGFPEGQPLDFGGFSGVLSASWGDLVTDAPGNYTIARLTFPRGQYPRIYQGEGTVPNPSNTSQVGPASTTIIPDSVPEPAAALGAAAAVILLLNRAPRRR